MADGRAGEGGRCAELHLVHSIVWASLAGLCFYAIALATNPIDRVLLCLGAALFCQLRLLRT